MTLKKLFGFQGSLQVISTTLVGALLFGAFAQHHPVVASVIGAITFVWAFTIPFQFEIASFTKRQKVVLVLLSTLLAIAAFIVFLQMTAIS